MANTAGIENEFSLASFLEETQKDYEQTQRDLKEIDILIKQSAAEVERLAQRNSQVTSYTRQLQTNFETLPREDIKEAYEALNDVQQRLFTMRGQLEKLQSDQRNLERLAEVQRKIMELTDGAMPLSSSGGRRRMEQPNVIRVIQTEEAVRQGLVRKMHDSVASSISNFILQAEICQRFFDVNPDRARTELNALKSSAGSTFSNVKDFIFDLRPMMLDDLGVVPTLRRYAESFQEKNGVPVPITVTGVERRLESHIEVTVFRNVQELLQNAMNHAQATQIQIQVDMGSEQVTAVVEDNGSGFNVDDALNGNGKTIGLSTLRERTEMLGGELNIQSNIGQGTRIEFSIPIIDEASL
ncbi:MAG: sensor histidine kinase [Ardenticatenaceae bacterium]|nr:sensor histidine kinase [Ardenticatenaceae bacterium]MCB8947191.1 sensor histidine kinase [Ardenticatenaceae bacterium]